MSQYILVIRKPLEDQVMLGELRMQQAAFAAKLPGQLELGLLRPPPNM